MRLSILDQSPISSHQTAKEALDESVALAQEGERMGYHRFWMTEHHDLPGLASSAPEVVLGYIGAKTKAIRLGTGAVLLPHYKPYKVAEVHHQLATLMPDRIDLGLGRAPGGSAEATNALNDNFLQSVYKVPDLVEELLYYLDNHDPKLTASPLPDVSPIPWMLGTSEKSALLAAENGLAYVFGQFMSNKDGPSIIQQYLDAFQPRKQGTSPEVMITISAVCAETTEKAEDIALSSLIWQLQKDKGEGGEGIPTIQEAKAYQLTEQEKEKLKGKKQGMLIGDPKEVKAQLVEMQKQYQADEIMIMTTTYAPKDRVRSYELIAGDKGTGTLSQDTN